MSERRRLLNQFERAGRDMAELPSWVRMSDVAKPEPSPDPSVPLSAIRALVQQWEKEIVMLELAIQKESHSETRAKQWLRLKALRSCLPEVVALCPAEDR